MSKRKSQRNAALTNNNTPTESLTHEESSYPNRNNKAQKNKG